MTAGLEIDGSETRPQALRPRFVIRMFQACVLLLLLSISIAFGGRWFGAQLADAGHSEATTLREIVIGNNVLSVPDNAIRFAEARHDGIAQRLDLYLRWPNLEGYSRETRDDFNHVDSSKQIIFLSFEEQMTSRDMSNRFETVYSKIIEPGPIEGPNGILFYRFKPEAGFGDEVLAVGHEEGQTLPFVARCLSGEAARQALAPCERDEVVGNNMSMTYRFPASLLAEWRMMEHAVRDKASTLIRGPR